MVWYVVTFAAGIAGGVALAKSWPGIKLWLSGETVHIENKIKDKL